jgi:tetratricopeptide (TPR) repeat protein
MHVGYRITRLRVWALIFVLLGVAAASAQNNTPPGRLRVTILGFANDTGNPEEAHWRCGIERLLSGELKKIKAIKLGGGVEYARRQLGIDRNSTIEQEQARRMGELIEAQRVAWGSYRKQNGQWHVRVQILNVASGKASDELEAACADWFELRDRLTGQILHELNIKPSEQERQKMGRRWTTSPEALEWYSRSCAYQEENKPLSEQEDCARKAIAADPKFARAYLALSAITSMQGKFTQAEQAVHQALKLRPNFAGAHRLAGVVSLFTGKNEEGERQLRQANRLDPDDARVVVRLAELSSLQRKWDEAIAFAEEARILEPTDASVHALLGFLYTFKGHRERAMVELKEAQRLDPEGLDVVQRIGQAYERMGEIPSAVENYERLVTQAKQLGAVPGVIRTFEERAQQLRASLVPTFIEAKIPKVCTEQSLQEILRERLTEDELKMVVNPIASSAEMKHWAEQLTEGATSDLDKAKAIFGALTGRLQAGNGHGARTAGEVFAAWDESDVSFSCQEYAKLFTALARDVNIKAFYVYVYKDYRDKSVVHACAAVFMDDRVLLVDPDCRWFGVPHMGFDILDDLHTIANQFSQLRGTDQDVMRCRLAVKLCPNFSWSQHALVGALCEANRWDEARDLLEVALESEPDCWDVYLLQGIIEYHDGHMEAANGYLRKVLEINKECALAHFRIAQILARQGKLEEARKEFRASLCYESEPKMAEEARQAIAKINELIGVEHSEIEMDERENNLVEGDN